MNILAVFGRNAYGRAARGESYEAANILPDLRAIAQAGGQVELFDSWDRTAHADFAAMNRALLDTIATFQPDVIFLVLMGCEVWTETLDLVRAQSPAAIVNWGTDDSWKYPQSTRFFARHVDLHVTTDAQACERASRDGLDNVVASQWAACAAKLSAPVASAQCRYDVSFVGAAYGNRPGWIAALAERGIKVDCFGKGWPSGVVAAEVVAEIFRTSRISLNLSDSGLQVMGGRIGRSRQIKARTFEVPGAGGFLLTEPAQGLERYFTIGREIETFASADALAGLIARYLGDPEARDAMARLAHARVVAEHTYAARLPALIDEARLRAGRRPCQEWRLDPTHLNGAVARHTTGPLARALADGAKKIATLALGGERGPRAVRRLVHEVSWRVAGAQTYGAAGWPGRLFHDES